jgi:hypothetical protein
MTRDDIIRMAREAGFNHPSSEKDTDYYQLDRFAALVAAAEREACAKLCDEMERRAEGTECCKWPTPADCAYTIRARGEKDAS